MLYRIMHVRVGDHPRRGGVDQSCTNPLRSMCRCPAIPYSRHYSVSALCAVNTKPAVKTRKYHVTNIIPFCIVVYIHRSELHDKRMVDYPRLGIIIYDYRIISHLETFCAVALYIHLYSSIIKIR